MVRENVPAPVRIDDEFLAHEVYRPLEHPLHLLDHFHPIEQRVPGVGLELHEHVHVAVGAKVVAQDGAEERELADLPLAAERLDLRLPHREAFRDVELVQGRRSVPAGSAHGAPISRETKAMDRLLLEPRCTQHPNVQTGSAPRMASN